MGPGWSELPPVGHDFRCGCGSLLGVTGFELVVLGAVVVIC